MEYRELPRIVASDDDGDDSAPRPRRFPLPRAGRIDLRKVATFSVLALSLAGILLYAGRQAIDSALTWLHAQPRYQLPFGAIQLPQPPPDCFLGGTSAFLEAVRRNAKEPETLSLLDVDPVRLRNAFKAFPWVEEVVSIERPPGELIVHLKYRRPVAKVSVTGAGQFVLDREGCLLPLGDVDVERDPRLIWIVGRDLTAPPRDRAGTLWKTVTADSPNREGLDRAVIQAAKLAGFFLEPGRAAEAEARPAVKVFSITVTAPRSNLGLFVKTEEDVQIQWGWGPGDEAAGEPSAAEKWELLLQQAQKGLDQKAPRDFWTFNRSKMVYRPYQPAPGS